MKPRFQIRIIKKSTENYGQDWYSIGDVFTVRLGGKYYLMETGHRITKSNARRVEEDYVEAIMFRVKDYERVVGVPSNAEMVKEIGEDILKKHICGKTFALKEIVENRLYGNRYAFEVGGLRLEIRASWCEIV